MAAKQRVARRRTESEWRGIVERFERNGMPATAFCRRIGVSPRTLQFWRWKLRQAKSKSRGLSEFVEVKPAAVAPAGAAPGSVVPLPFGRWTIDVIFPDGTTARMGG
jgi:transposase-like protein